MIRGENVTPIRHIVPALSRCPSEKTTDDKNTKPPMLLYTWNKLTHIYTKLMKTLRRFLCSWSNNNNNKINQASSRLSSNLAVKFLYFQTFPPLLPKHIYIFLAFYHKWKNEAFFSKWTRLLSLACGHPGNWINRVHSIVIDLQRRDLWCHRFDSLRVILRIKFRCASLPAANY